MAQHDYIISNQTFPNTRADINNLASAIATNNSGTSAPTTQYAGQFWIDTTTSTWTLYIHDGTDDIQFATIDTSANTVNFTDSALDVVTDTTPQLGGDLDLNSSDITGTGNINITGTVTATSFSGDGSSLTGVASDVVDDTTPQLGGNLDLNSNDITGTGNIDITGNVTADIVNIYNASQQGRLNVSNNGAEQLEVFPGDVSNKVTLQAFNRSTVASNSFRYIASTHEFITGGSERMRIDGSGNVGIGTSSPTSELHIVDSSANAVLRLEASATGQSNIFFDDTSANIGKIEYFHTDNSMRFSTDTAERMRIDSSGNVLVGKTSDTNIVGVSIRADGQISLRSTANPLIVRKDSGTGNLVVFGVGAINYGSITTDGSSVAYNTTSDHRLKENVVDITGATNRLKQLQPKRFNFIVNPDTTVDGFLAHEVSDIVPEAITGTKDEVDDEGNPIYQGIDQSKLVPLLTASLKEAINKIEQLEARISALET